MLDKHIKEYCDGFSFELTEHISTAICGINVEIDVLEYNDARNERRKAHVILYKDNLKYECECVDYHDWNNMFFPVTLSEQTFLCFRKTLYGFTLLNIDTLREDYEYFHECVLRHQESFIMITAKSYGNLIIFDGCYWNGPDAFYIFDYEHRRFLNLSEELGINGVKTSKVENGVLILYGADQNDAKSELKVTNDEIDQLLNKKGTSDYMSL